MKKISFKKIKKETMYMMFTVICLSITMISTSYSIFFDVKTNKNEQTITTGSLTVQVTDSSIYNSFIYPYSDAEGLETTAQSVFYLQNSGTTNGAFTFSLVEGANHTLSNEYIKLALFEYTPGSEVTSTLISDIITLSDCTVNEDGEYVFYSSTLSSGSTATYTIKFWLDESSPETIISEAIDLEIDITSEVLESVMIYDFSGTLSNSNGVLSNATISLNNGSIIGTTNTNGVYSLEDLRAGTYSVTITLDDGTVIKDTLKVGEDLEVSTSFTNDVYTVFGGLETSVSVNFVIDSNGITSVEAN